MTWAPRAGSWLRTTKAGTECLLLLLQLLGSKKTCPGNHHSFLTPLIVLLFFSPLAAPPPVFFSLTLFQLRLSLEMCVHFDVLKGISTGISGHRDFHYDIASWSGIIFCLFVSGFNFVAKWWHIYLFNLFCIRESRLNDIHPVWLAVSLIVTHRNPILFLSPSTSIRLCPS